jgi:hypothetical protein
LSAPLAIRSITVRNALTAATSGFIDLSGSNQIGFGPRLRLKSKLSFNRFVTCGTSAARV